MSCFSAHRVGLSRGDRRILRNAGLAVEPGEVVTLVGPNGAGKSTLLRCMTGELVPDEGECRLDDVAIRRLGTRELARCRAVLPQDSGTGFPLVVEDVVALGRAPWQRHASPQDNRRAVVGAAAAAGVSNLMQRDFRSLSGGERQLVQLARVLAQVWDTRRDGRPRYLLLDEPTSNLDVGHQQRLLTVVRQVLPMGIGVLAVLHDLNLAAAFAERVCLLTEGRIVTQGPPADVIRRGHINAAYEASLDVRIDGTTGRPLVLPGLSEQAAS